MTPDTTTMATTPNSACHQVTLAMAADGDEVMKNSGVASRGKCQ